MTDKLSAWRRQRPVALSFAPRRLQVAQAILAALLALAMMVLLTLAIGGARAQQPAALRDAAGFVYTANERGNSISSIELATGRTETVPTAISPRNVQIGINGRRLLAVGDAVGEHAETHSESRNAHGSTPEGQLLVFNALNLASGPSTSIAAGDYPAHAVVDEEGQYAFATVVGENALAVVDLSRNKVTRKIGTGQYPHGLRISPDGRTAYIANVKGGNVSIVDLTSFEELARIPVGKAPVQVGFTPDGRRVYVSLRDENAVVVVDTNTREIVARIAVGRNPIQVHATPDGRFVYVANQGSDADPADTVSVIEVASNEVVREIRTGARAHGVAVDSGNRYVFVTNIVNVTVSVIDVESQSVVAAFPVGRGPNGISFLPRER